jgi:Methyltransferase domain
VPLTRLDFDPFLHDPARWGASLSQAAEIVIACLDAARARSVVEVGGFAGDLTRLLVEWATATGASVATIDPAPRDSLVGLARDSAGLELIEETSLEALARIELPNAVVIDGDHNYWTVSEELRLIGERSEESGLPLLIFHDVCWPHGRRDDYFDVTRIPEDHRHPVAGDGGGIVPGEEGLRPGGGLPYPRSAAREGGPRNGVLTAVEDFVAGRDGLRLVVVPVFFGVGAVWDQRAPWSGNVARLLDPLDRNPVLERLEANRVHHIAEGHTRLAELWRLQDRQRRQEAVLRRLLESSAFGVAERLSRARVRARIATGQSVVSKDEVRRALAD